MNYKEKYEHRWQESCTLQNVCGINVLFLLEAYVVFSLILLSECTRTLIYMLNSRFPSDFGDYPLNANCIRSSVSAATKGYILYLRFDLNESSTSLCCGWHRRAYAVCVHKMALWWQIGEELWKKLVIFIFCVQKYSRYFVKFRLNHWWQTEYSDDVFHSFLFLNCVPKTNKAFVGLERHEGEWLMTTFSFWGRVTL